MNKAYGPLTRALPLTRADETFKEPRKYDSDSEDHPTDFYHPAVGEPIRPIWIPRDSLGLGIAEAEVRANKKAYISSGCRNAKMDEKGRVEVTGHPPKWHGSWEDENGD